MEKRMIKRMMCVAAAVALFTPVAHAGCEGLSGKELKNCEKAAKAQAKADARTTAFTPSELDAKFKAWDGDANPFNSDSYRVRYGNCGLESVDSFAKDAARLDAVVGMTRFVIDEIGKGNADAIAAAPALVGLLKAVPTDGQALIEKGKAMPDTLPNEVSGADAMKLPKCLPLVSDSLSNLQNAVKSAPEVTTSLMAVAKDPSAAAGAGADMATEAATEKATEAVEGAVE
jgi:hypothetical protein